MTTRTGPAGCVWCGNISFCLFGRVFFVVCFFRLARARDGFCNLGESESSSPISGAARLSRDQLYVNLYEPAKRFRLIRLGNAPRLAAFRRKKNSTQNTQRRFKTWAETRANERIHNTTQTTQLRRSHPHSGRAISPAKHAHTLPRPPPQRFQAKRAAAIARAGDR